MSRLGLTCEPIVDRAVFILGAARSGTSALAGALELFGLSLGPVVRDPSRHNERGHFENAAIQALDRAVLGPPGMIEDLPVDAEIDAAVHEILSMYPRGTIGIKEPYLLFTLALWARHARRIALVGTLRHPWNFARSVVARARSDDADPRASFGRWRRFNARLLEIRRLVDFPILDFDAARAEYLDQLAHATTALGLRFHREDADAFVADELVHQREGGPLPPEIQSIYDELLRFSRDRPRAEELGGGELVRRLDETIPHTRTEVPERVLVTAWRQGHLGLARAVREVQGLEAERQSVLRPTLGRARPTSRVTQACTPVIDRAVFVLGMHRSGTSALAGALERFGLQFGPVARTMSPHNAFGNYENGAVIALDRAVLGPLGTSEAPMLDPAVDAVLHEILARYPAERIGIKEPNLVFTLPLWANHVRTVSLIGSVRHPLKVARSIEDRDGAEGRMADRPAALEEWRQFNVRLLDIRRSITFPLLDFDAPRAAYLDRLRDSAIALGLRYDAAAAEAFVSEDLIHQRDDGELTPELTAIYDELRAYAAEPAVAEVLEGPDLVRRLGGVVRAPSTTRSPSALVDVWRDNQLARARLLLLVAASDAEIRRLQDALEEAVDVRDAEIRRLQGVLETVSVDRDAESRRTRSQRGDRSKSD